MATGPLRFCTPHIDELPTTGSRQAPGFAWVAVSGAQDDPAKNWGTSNRKRARASLNGPTEQQKEALSARQQREVERKIRDLNSDNSKNASELAIPKKEGGAGASGAVRAGKTPNTKKILGSGKTFAHYLDDEEAEIARTGRRDVDVEVSTGVQRPSKTPIARRKTREDSSVSGSPAPVTPMAPPPWPRTAQALSYGEITNLDDVDDEGEDAVPPLPSEAQLEALLNAPPLTYGQARSRPPSSSAAPPRRFCETCGYWGRVRCMKCGAMTCSVTCKDDHDQFKCLKMYA
ncbi:hypothetical protein LTR36_007535 [Oleoguttula mirabilis]|uniref:HIT-type domain-containing protein n=1 Tax=Oleoguttula mirabilis TaxID=1507867 RepID=A0AAV9JU46_9PEZI|nr:hypothetical protein LTR36_007535 [Oleoguttula mirabilis]